MVKKPESTSKGPQYKMNVKRNALNLMIAIANNSPTAVDYFIWVDESFPMRLKNDRS